MTAKRQRRRGSTARDYAARRAQWVEEMVANCNNHTAAAEAIGHKAGWAAQKAGYRYSQDPVAQKMLEKRSAQMLAKRRITADGSMHSLSCDLNFDPAKLFDVKGRPLEPHEMDEDTRKALRGHEVEIVETGEGKRKKRTVRIKVKYPEKTAAREQAMKHFGLYERDNKQKPFYTPPQLVVVGVPGRGK